ncbi:hypothetical protein L1987_85205 [Smallanthus sonchifolius]|uniref:Uncharacterized protein n=1 Tax=Smallanthus sonchifolius TaxID=185202 RepID=A0ACB8XVX3_9ASTR|nr:hypothetical protein L1987_85205 [Smallanthus sonchifolius]
MNFIDSYCILAASAQWTEKCIWEWYSFDKKIAQFPFKKKPIKLHISRTPLPLKPLLLNFKDCIFNVEEAYKVLNFFHVSETHLNLLFLELFRCKKVVVDRRNMYRKRSSVWSSMFGNEEFQETDVWSVIDERKDYDSKSVRSIGSTSGYSSRTNSHPTAAKMIPRPRTNNYDIESRIPQQQSAPVNIPDWSKIYGKSKRASQKFAFLDYGYDVGDGVHHNRKESWDSDDDHDHGNMIPPHEWIAQKLARNQISSFSVCEGAGRTLKGRDLSRPRIDRLIGESINEMPPYIVNLKPSLSGYKGIDIPKNALPCVP